MNITTADKICARCVMDTTADDIVFFPDGTCSYCRLFFERAERELHQGPDGLEKIHRIAQRAREAGKNSDYDCVIGLSGGVDSSMVAHHVVKLGLRPLAIHLDNGWNAELAVANVENIVKTLNIDLMTHVLDWEEFRDLQRSFIMASVINLEIPTDHAITAILYRQAAKHGIRYIFSGSNIATEAIMPAVWGYDNKDWRHVKGIHRRFGTKTLKSYPHISLFDWVRYTFVNRIRFIPILNYVDFDKDASLDLLKEKYGWRSYGSKHWESIFTRFFQAYILPRKCGIDKRKAHFATLICAGQLSREKALEILSEPPCPEGMAEQDRQYFVKKLGFTDAEFEKFISEPPRPFTDYPNNHFWFEKLGAFVRVAKRMAKESG